MIAKASLILNAFFAALAVPFVIYEALVNNALPGEPLIWLTGAGVMIFCGGTLLALALVVEG